ncbi:MAG: twin transmembrane helix small protein [Pseudomonadota bacterium]
MKVLILIMLAAIVGSLMSGLFFLTRQDEKSSARMLASLKIRVGLSILLVAFLVSAFFLGLIPTE